MSKNSVAHYQRINGRRLLPSKYRGHRSSYGRRRRPWGRYLLLLVLLFVLLGLGAGGYLYTAPAGRPEADTTYILVAPGAKYPEFRQQLQSKLWLRYPRLFGWLADYRGLSSEPLRPGRYAITRDMNMAGVIDELQHGADVPLVLQPGALRTNVEILDFFAAQLWVKRDSLEAAFSDPALLSRYGMTRETLRAQLMRQPLTLRWTATGRELLDSIHSGYQRFWRGARSEAAQRLGLTPLQVTTLASIVESESAKRDEYSRIAGLYLNRLRQGIKLQSDPTVKYATGNFALKRIKGEHLATESPYNTYRVVGLPPAPIVLPHTATIDSVLAAEAHDYLYMCAREDFSGYHRFAARFSEHLVNAKLYQQELNKRGIN